MRPITIPKPKGSATPWGTPSARDLRQPGAQGGARKGARQDAHEGDADLDGGEEPAQILHELQGDRRRGVPFRPWP